MIELIHTPEDLQLQTLQSFSAAVFDDLKLQGDVTVIFLTDTEIQELNIQHLQHDYPTDILTFNLSETANLEAEIYIGHQTARANAKHYNSTFAMEIRRLVSHGLLHLKGFLDQTQEEKNEMTRQEDRLLSLYVPRET